MLEKWTKTSSAPSREMKPKPFSALKNFTVPVATLFSSLLFTATKPHWPARPDHPRGPGDLSPHRAAFRSRSASDGVLEALADLHLGHGGGGDLDLGPGGGVPARAGSPLGLLEG